MAKKLTGADFLLYTGEGEDKTALAGQRSATLNREMEELDATTKDDGRYKDTMAGFMSWEIEAEGVVVEDDAAFDAIETAFENGERLFVSLTTTSGNSYQGHVYIIEFPIEAPYDDVATYTMKLAGSGRLDRVKAPTGE